MKRRVESILTEYLSYFPVVAIVGVRQSGKTTLLRTLGSDWSYLDLERAADYDLLAQDPDLFLRLHPKKVAIDEAQLLPSLFAALRVAVDEDRSSTGRFVITGSSSPDLHRSIAESLAGRVATIELSPLMWAEVTAAGDGVLERIASGDTDPDSLIEGLPERGSLALAHRYWFSGGYPEPWVRSDARFTELWTEQYLSTYLDRDIRRLFPGLDLPTYRTFVGMLAGISGQVVNLSDLARALGVSQPTARRYLDIAHGSFVWRSIPAFTATVSKRVVKHPKGYLRDSGLLHHLLRIADLDALVRHPVVGRSWEGMVVEEVLRRFCAMGVPVDASYYRTAAGAEVDLVCAGKWGLLPIEIKRGERVDRRDLLSLRNFMEEIDAPIGIVINADRSPRRYDSRIIGVPFTHL